MAAKVQTLTTRVEPKIKSEVVSIAKADRRTVSQVVALLVIEALAARQAKEAVAS